MEKKNEVLMKFGVMTKNGRQYLENEMTRNRVWNTDGDGSYYSGTMLERLNGIVWFNEKIWRGNGHCEPIKKTNLPPIIGEMSHPDRFETSLKDVTHSIDNFKLEESNLLGDVKILQTPMGVKLQALMESAPDSIVFRPRGTGIINENKEVTEYEVFAFDAINKQDDAF